MNNGKPNWWSRPSSTPEAARIPTPPPADAGDGDFPLPAPQPAPGQEPADLTETAPLPAAPATEPRAPEAVA
ncbi:protease, partial [Streptomyces tanashiensis]